MLTWHLKDIVRLYEHMNTLCNWTRMIRWPGRTGGLNWMRSVVTKRLWNVMNEPADSAEAARAPARATARVAPTIHGEESTPTRHLEIAHVPLIVAPGLGNFKGCGLTGSSYHA